MEINKQLFEDVLSGKLKGTFVLRNGDKIPSKCLQRNCKTRGDYPYYLNNLTITPTGNHYRDLGISSFDIIEFIPDTNMKTNELTIEIPDGKIVDWDESKKQNKIISKDIGQLTYEEICNKLSGMIDIPLFDTPSEDGNALVANKHYLECLLAKNKLATVAKYLNDGWWIPSNGSNIFLLIETQAGVSVSEAAIGSCASDCGSIWFKSKEIALQAIKILGEETVKLALDPLGI